jgi:TonB family protein
LEHDYNRIADGRILSGAVILELLVDTRGIATDLGIRRSAGATLDSLAIQILRDTDFYPAYLDRSPVCFRLQVPMHFPPASVGQ